MNSFHGNSPVLAVVTDVDVILFSLGASVIPWEFCEKSKPPI